MAGKQCKFSDKKAEKRPLFDEIWLEFQISYQRTPCTTFFGIKEVVKLSVSRCECELKMARTTSKRNQ